MRGLLCDCGCVVLLSVAGWSGTAMCGDDSGLLCFVRMTGIHVFDVLDEAEPCHVAWAALCDHHNEVPTESRNGMHVISTTVDWARAAITTQEQIWQLLPCSQPASQPLRFVITALVES